MLRQLISKWGIMSLDMMSAMDADMTVINEDGTKDYVETEEIIEVEATEAPREAVTAQNPGNSTPTTEKAATKATKSDAAAALFGGN